MTYTANSPFQAPVIIRNMLCDEMGKQIMHVELDLSDSNISYQPGDCIGIVPENNPSSVGKIISCLQVNKKDLIVNKRSGATEDLHSFLLSKANITMITKKLLQLIIDHHSNEAKKAQLQQMLLPEQKEVWSLYAASHELWDLLEENSESCPPPQKLCDLLPRLLPRLYSIASSQRVAGNAVHLTIALVSYTTNSHTRLGVCSNFIQVQNQYYPIYLQPTNHFLLPEDSNKDVIMVGPGTGVAPFRGFMQDRIATQAKGKNWLFFGERHESSTFYYKELWHSLVKKNQLKLTTAFSRDQDHKIYVQDRLLEHAEEIWSWLENGAYFYVCGDAKHMAKDVEQALVHIAMTHGKLDSIESKNFIKDLRKSGRYLRDVY